MSNATNRHLAAAARRAGNPDEFDDVRDNLELGVGAAEVQAAARHFQHRADEAYNLYGLRAPPKSPDASLTNPRRRRRGPAAVFRDAEALRFPAGRDPRAASAGENADRGCGRVEFKKPEGPERSSCAATTPGAR